MLGVRVTTSALVRCAVVAESATLRSSVVLRQGVFPPIRDIERSCWCIACTSLHELRIAEALTDALLATDERAGTPGGAGGLLQDAPSEAQQ